MAIIDLNKERQRLAQVYAGMGEVELREAAGEAGSLTEIAKAALRFEILRRGLEIELDESSVAANDVSQRKLVTLRRFRDLPEAHIAKSILESAGIECFLGDVNLIFADWLWSNAIGGIKLWVKPEDAEAAEGLLNQSVVESFDAGEKDEFRQPRCPNCQSLDISFEELNKPVAYTSVMLGLPVPLKRDGWKCHSCGHAWQDPDDQAPSRVPS